MQQQENDSYLELLRLAEEGAYQAGVDHCFSVLDAANIDRAFWTLQIGLLYFLNFWRNGTLFEEAPRFVERAVRLNPASADAHFWFGHIYDVSFKDTKLARREYDNALEIDPSHLLARFSLAADCLPPVEARPHIEMVLEEQPSNYRALMTLADIATRLGDDEAAIKALNTLLDRSPYEEHLGGVMNFYINTELNFSELESRIVAEARKKLAALKR